MAIIFYPLFRNREIKYLLFAIIAPHIKQLVLVDAINNNSYKLIISHAEYKGY